MSLQKWRLPPETELPPAFRHRRTLMYYDGPVLELYSVGGDEFFLCMRLDEDDSVVRSVLIPVSRLEMKAMIDGERTLYDALVDVPEYWVRDDRANDGPVFWRATSRPPKSVMPEKDTPLTAAERAAIRDEIGLDPINRVAPVIMLEPTGSARVSRRSRALHVPTLDAVARIFARIAEFLRIPLYPSIVPGSIGIQLQGDRPEEASLALANLQREIARRRARKELRPLLEELAESRVDILVSTRQRVSFLASEGARRALPKPVAPTARPGMCLTEVRGSMMDWGFHQRKFVIHDTISKRLYGGSIAPHVADAFKDIGVMTGYVATFEGLIEWTGEVPSRFRKPLPATLLALRKVDPPPA